MCDELVSTDIVDDIGALYQGEIYEKGDLAIRDDMMRVLEGADMVVHRGAYADEGSFEKLLGPHFEGACNIWEAAYQHGLKRVVYGVSNNDRTPVDTAKAGFLGYRPQDNAKQFAAAILAETEAMDTQDPGNRCHGGPFAVFELGKSGVATMNIIGNTRKT